MLRLHTLGRLWIDNDGAPVASEPRPRRMALLAILASAGSKGVTRDQMLSILWAESEPDKARHSLSQALYSLRRELGVGVVVETPNLSLDPAKLTSDVAEFRTAVAEKNWEQAGALYAGPFLDGFYLSEAPHFERWAEEERIVLSRQAVRALEQLAARPGPADGGRSAWERLTKLDPLNGRFAVRYMEALVGVGDRLGALKHGQAHAELLRRELDTEPDAEVVALMGKLRGSGAPLPPAGRPSIQRPVGTTTLEHLIRGSANLARRRRLPNVRVSALIAVVSVIVAVGVLWAATRSRFAKGGEPSSAKLASPLAQRLFESGLQAFFQSDPATAGRLFGEVLKHDSSYAPAVYFAWRAEAAVEGPRQTELETRARELAQTSAERDRLLIATHLAATRWELQAAALAETLATRFPNDPDALTRAAEVAPDLGGAVGLLDRAISADSLAASQPGGICRACEALSLLAQRFAWADSVRGVEETLARWTKLRPADFQPWRARAAYLVSLGRKRDAESAAQRADSLGAPRPRSPLDSLELNLRLDEWEAAAERCRARLDMSGPTELPRFRWLCAIALRNMGRYRDALGLIHDGRNPWSGIIRGGLTSDRVHMAILDMEMRRGGAAADQYLRMASDTSPAAPVQGRFARNAAWELALAGTAIGWQGDTIRLHSLVDSVELAGHRSLYGRDPLLHHFLRGLLFASSGQHAAAVTSYRAGLWFPANSYSRINYELARSLVALNRPNEAIGVLRSALRGGFEGSGLYLTRTDVHERLAQSFVAAGQRDSAAAHYRVVEGAWRTADSFLSERLEAARQWLSR